MKKINLPAICLILVPLLLFSGIQAIAQMPSRGGNQVAVTGWVDDTHYLFRAQDADLKLVTKSVDIRTGKSAVVPASKSDRELLTESLPSGVMIGMNDVVSPDYKSVVIAKDNDLYYFVKGLKELTRLTNDKTSEVNTRFSPDGKNIAFIEGLMSDQGATGGDIFVIPAGGGQARNTTGVSKLQERGIATWPRVSRMSMSTAILTAAAAVRFPVRVCSINNFSFSIVNSKSCTSR